jgi:phenylacetate-CoA ligase
MLRKHIYSKLVYPAYRYIKKDKAILHTKELYLNQWLSKERLEKLQQDKLVRLLKHAAVNVPYYSRIIRQIGLEPEKLAQPENFQLLPYLTKEVIRNNIRDLISTYLSDNSIFKNRTSGSTGEALFFYTDTRSIDYRKASVFRNKKWVGYTNGDKEVMIWGSPIDINKYKTLRNRLHSLITGSYMISAYEMSKDKMDQYIVLINKFKPRIIVSYPSILEVFAEHCQKKNASFPSLTGIITSAETLFPDQRKLFESVFNVKVFNRYGCREVGDIAQECGEHSGLHLNSDRILMEIIDEHGQPCRSGQIGEIYITDLDNYGMPFIRYQIGDRAAWSPEICPCKRGLHLLSHVDGRSLDVVMGPNGNRIGGTFWTILFKKRPGVKQFQLIQERMDLIRVLYVPDGELKTESKEYFNSEIFKKCGENMQIEYEKVTLIPKTSSGKIRIVVSNIN